MALIDKPCEEALAYLCRKPKKRGFSLTNFRSPEGKNDIFETVNSQVLISHSIEKDFDGKNILLS